MRNHDKPSILDVKMTCRHCGWVGTLYDAEPDTDGDGAPGCPDCFKLVETQDKEVL